MCRMIMKRKKWVTHLIWQAETGVRDFVSDFLMICLRYSRNLYHYVLIITVVSKPTFIAYKYWPLKPELLQGKSGVFLIPRRLEMACVENIPPVNGDSEMEEGEIVDDVDDLSDISSEEEFLLRQRLQVLENYNNVLERKKAKRSFNGSGNGIKSIKQAVYYCKHPV